MSSDALRAVLRSCEGLAPGNGPVVPLAAEGPPRAVEILLERDHPFKKRGRHPTTGKKQIGCEVCRAGKLDPSHMGAPPSMNGGNHSMQPQAYQALKHAWQKALAVKLLASGLEKGLEAVSVEALVGFPTLTARDGGNYRWMIEKALGDALQEHGFLEDDCFFPVSRYEFGGIQGVLSKGRSWLLLMVVPRPARVCEYRDDLVLPDLPLVEREQLRIA